MLPSSVSIHVDFDLQGIAQGRPISNYCFSPLVILLPFFPVHGEPLQWRLAPLRDYKQFLCHLNSILPQDLLFIWWIINGTEFFFQWLGCFTSCTIPPFLYKLQSFLSSVECTLDTFIFKFVAYDTFLIFMEVFIRSTVFISLTLRSYNPINVGSCGILSSLSMLECYKNVLFISTSGFPVSLHFVVNLGVYMWNFLLFQHLQHEGLETFCCAFSVMPASNYSPCYRIQQRDHDQMIV